MPIKQVLTEGERPVKVWTEELDPYARAQLVNLSKLPFIHRHVAAMPDVHGGIGATIDSVIATHKATIPAAVGVDIGCGMAAVRTSLSANDTEISRAARDLFQAAPWSAKSARLIGLGLSGWESKTDLEPDLFASDTPNPDPERDRLDATLDAIQGKFGRGTIQRGLNRRNELAKSLL